MNDDPGPRRHTFFEHLSRARVQAVLNVLVEAPFFYKSDSPELFTFLRRNLSEFQRFYEELYGWRLVADVRAARLYKPRWHNPALKPSQHDVFELTRRDDCIAFLLVLEFYEHLLDERNASPEDPEPQRFEFGELFAFARGRLQEALAERAPDDDGTRRLLRSLMPTLLRYRFLREVPPSREEREGLHPDRYLYDCLPALHHYDVRALGPSALANVLRAVPSGAGDEVAESGERIEAAESGEESEAP
jgi:hypothetical protein